MSKITNKDFVHHHVHSSASLFDGLCNIDDLVMEARGMGFPGLAITDHGTVANWIKFIQHCKATKDKNGKDIPFPPIKYILGVEAYLSADHEHHSNKEQTDGRGGNRHLNLFAKNFKGYQNICQLSQKSFTDGFFHDPRIDINQLAEHSEGVIVGSACLSSVINSNLLYARYKEAKKTCSLFKDIFKEDFFLEVMFHGIPEEALIIPDILKLSKELDIPVICTNDSHYLKKEDAKSQEVLMAMSTSRCIHDPKRYRFPYGEFYLKSAAEMAKVWESVPSSLSNSVAMLERIDHNDIEKNLFGGMRLPRFDVPEGFKNPFDYLKHLATEGMKKRGWSDSKKHIERLKIELDDVQVAYEHNDYDFSTYFLIVWDYINYAREKNIYVGSGRGSGYGSLLLHCLGICSGLDPIKFNLLWERFLGFSEQKFILEADFGF
tara:strand:+ start:1429 stop:2730 length:1302 start_codon:yes stop_codon:yes gene_type:complete